MADSRPFADGDTLLAVSDEIWQSLSEADWKEAFCSHPRIGESDIGRPENGESGDRKSQVPNVESLRSIAWSEQEQRAVAQADDAAKFAISEGNREYERRFKRIFIVCATGKSSTEILAILRRRLENDDATELKEAAEQQRQIMNIRLRKWLHLW